MAGKVIQVLMSTYNGDEYLKEQIDSILAQDCEKKAGTKLKLLIRDDGSKDGKSAVPRKERREQMGMWNIEKVKEFSIEVVDRQMRKIYAEVTGEPVG